MLLKNISDEDVANLPTTAIKSLAVDKNNVLWIGTYRGLRVIYNTTPFFSHNSVRTAQIIIIADGLPKALLAKHFIAGALMKGLMLNYHFMQPQLFVILQALLLILLWILLIQLFHQNINRIPRAPNSLSSQVIETNMAILSTICFTKMKILMLHKGSIIFKSVDLIYIITQYLMKI